MAEDISVGNWDEVTPEAMKLYSESKLLYAMELNRGGVHDQWARAELARRRDERISELISSLTSSSDRLEGLTRRLNRLTWVLIILTFLAVLVPIGLEIWNAYHPST
jgi:hypothetical protein